MLKAHKYASDVAKKAKKIKYLQNS